MVSSSPGSTQRAKLTISATNSFLVAPIFVAFVFRYQSVYRSTPQDLLPLYIPAGSILPFGPEVQYSTEKPWDDLEIRVYAGADGQFTLYEDEFDGYGYQQGAYSEIPFTWNEATQTLTIGQRRGEFTGMLKQRTFRIVRVSSHKGTGDQPSTIYDQIVTYSGSAISIQLEEALESEQQIEDATQHIVNPSFEADGRTLTKQTPKGWTVKSETAWWGVNVGGGDGDPVASDGQYIFGMWDGSATHTPIISQTINTLPKGQYTLTVDMQASNRSEQIVRLGKQYVFANEQKGFFAEQLSTAGVSDTYPMQTIAVNFEQESDFSPVTIGVSTEGAKSETWFKIDNFRLYRLGEDTNTNIPSINHTQKQNTTPTIYDLTGRKVSQSPGNTLPKGIYITNQQKRIIK